jgi:hypothetical protein
MAEDGRELQQQRLPVIGYERMAFFLKKRKKTITERRVHYLNTGRFPNTGLLATSETWGSTSRSRDTGRSEPGTPIVMGTVVTRKGA